MSEDAMSAMREVILERYLIGLAQVIPETSLLDVSVTLERTAQRMVAAMKTWVLAGVHDKPQIHVREYASWWEHFKGEKFPAWLLAKFPPKMHEEIIIPNNTVYVCPHSNVKWPDERHFGFMRETHWTGPSVIDARRHDEERRRKP